MTFPFRDLRDTLPTRHDVPYWKTRKPYEVKFLVIHHTATQADVTPQQIHEGQLKRNYGTEEKPSYPPRITYHGVIDQHGVQWKVNDYGSVVWAAPGYNRNGVHLCLLGNFEYAEVPEVQYASMLQWGALLMTRYPITPERVFRHGDVTATKCPGRFFQSLTQLRADLQRTIPSIR